MKKYTILLLVCIWLIIPLHSEIVAPTEGHTQVFNVLGQGFFEGYYPITATCQKVGTSYYIFTEDVQVNDVSISPVDPNHLLIATSTGIYISDDAGKSWQFASGTGSKMLEPDYNGGSAANADAHRAPCLVSFYMKESEWWTGAESGAYQTKDGGESWSKKTRGLPNYVDENGEGVFPPFYRMMLDDHVTDYETNRDYWACSQAGLFYWSSSKFIDMGTGLPQTVSDWEHLAVYDFIKDDDQGYIATELGLYKGTINMDDNMVSWVPIGGADVTVASSAYDSVLVIVLDGVTMNTYVNVVDKSKSLYWRCKVEKSGDNLIVVINDENLYFSDEAFFDPATLDYATYDASAVEVFQPANISISKLVKDDSGLLYYVVGTEIYKLNTDHSSELVYDAETGINDLVCHSGKMYIATANGLLSANMDDLTTWTKETGLLTEGSTEGDSINYDVKTVEFDDNGNMYVGCHMGGLIRKEAGTGEWTNLNVGLGHRAVLPEKVEYLSKAFDSLQVQSVLGNWFGELPDVDNDAKQYCLIVDLDDYYYLNAGDGVSFIDGFFNPVDQLSKGADSNSNELDIIYIDSDPLDLFSPSAWAAVTNALAVEIIQSKPVAEEEWFYRGLAELGELIVGLKDTVSQYNLNNNNSLLAVGDISPTVADYDYCFTFFDYLYCHYFNDATKMNALVAREEAGIEGLDSALSIIGGPNFKEVFNDYTAAVFYDGLDYPDIPEKYKFPNIKVGKSTRVLEWGFSPNTDSPFLVPQIAWSFIFYKTTGYSGGVSRCPNFSKLIVFNGEDEASFDFKAAMLKDDDYIDSVLTLNEDQVCKWDVSDYFGNANSEYQELYFLITAHETPDVGGTSFLLNDKETPAGEFSLGFNFNAGAPDYLNIFCFSDNQMFDDAGKAKLYDSDGNGTADLEGPVGELITNSDTTDLNLQQFFIDAEINNYVYSLVVDISEIAEAGSEVNVELVGENLNSVKSTTTANGVLAKTTKTGYAQIALNKGQANITFQEGSFSREQSIAAFVTTGNLAGRSQSHYELGRTLTDILYINSGDLHPAKPVKIRMQLKDHEWSSTDDKIPVVFTIEKNELKPISLLNADHAGDVIFETDKLGSIQVILAKREVLNEIEKGIPNTFALAQNYPNPFNSSTSIRYQLPVKSDVRILIFDLMGRQVKTLYQGVQNAGYHSVEWNGLSDDNRLLPSGVYFYRMISSDFQATEKMIYLK